MNRTRALIVSLAVGLAAVAGVFALGNTFSLGKQAHATTDRRSHSAPRTHRYEASLRKALAQKPPRCRPYRRSQRRPIASSASAPVQSATPVRVIYHRPPPIIVIKHRAGGEHESEAEGAGQDD